MIRSLVALGAALMLAVVVALPVSAAEMCDSGRTFGRDHISGEARNGVLGPDVHPGMHGGFSGCVK